MALRGELSGLVIQQIVGVSKLRVTAAEQRAYGQWSQLFARQQRVVRAAANLGNLQAAFTVGWIPVTTLVLFGWLYRRGLDAIDPGTFLAFFAAFGQILVANRAITAALGGLLQTVPLYERARPILDAVPEVVANAQDPGVLTGQVEVKHVDFRYAADGPMVLRDVLPGDPAGPVRRRGGAVGRGQVVADPAAARLRDRRRRVGAASTARI